MLLDPKSKTLLAGVHADLRRVFVELANDPSATVAINGTWRVTSGLRTLEEQRRLVATGASRTMRSRHLEGHAVDLAIIRDGKAVWDIESFRTLNVHVQAAAKRLGVPVVWGGSWKTFVDAVHWELSRRAYSGVQR